MDRKIKRQLKVGFAFAILLVLLVGSISLITFQKQYQEGELVKHSYRVINQLQTMQTVLVDMETGRRGFRSTNQRSFLEPYNAGLKQVQPALGNLHILIKDDPQQIQRAEILRDAVTDLLNYWASLGEDASKYTRERITEITSLEKVKMDDIKRQLSEMEKVESRLLVDREMDNNKSVRNAKLGLIVGILLILIIVILLIQQILKELNSRRKVEEKLRTNNKELSAVNQENADRNWLLNGLAKVNNILQGHLDATALSQLVLDTVVKYLDIKAGAFYVYDKDVQKLMLTASYALPNTVKKEYDLHEGLVGQAAAQKEPLIISDVPAKYATIDSATIRLEPVHAIYALLLHNDELKGIIEVLSFQPIAKESLQLLTLVSNNIAVALHAVEERKKIQGLLEQVQRQKEVLEHQQEELRQTNEELTVQAEVLQTSEEELRVQEEELRQINAELKEKNTAIEKAGLSLSRKARELEESSKYKSEFLANMSHELRTPLNSVLILAKLLSENKDQNLTEKQVAHAKIIRKSGADLLELINDILDLSKIEAGKVDLHIENVSVETIATDLEQLFAVVAEEKGIKYEIEILDGVPENIKTDKQKVQQVLRNLLSNAFKFTSENGQVKLQFKKVIEDNKEYLCMSVADSGIGIPETKQQVIFEAFQQADGSTNRKYGGTGLGLSITKELMRILKGKLFIESQEHKGSNFTILIPFDTEGAGDTFKKNNPQISPPKTEIQVIEQTAIHDDRKKIVKEDRVMLIIEDDKDFAIIIREFAKSNGFKAIIALSGDEGFYCAKKYLPSAVILDMKLPGIDGATLLKMLKEDEQLKNIPVHVISASEETDLLSGALAFLKKPVKKEDLNNAFTLISEYLNASVKRVLIFSSDNLSNEVGTTLTNEKNYGIVCDSASSLKEGLEKLDKVKYDCIIADIGINIEEGISKLSALNQHLLPEHIPTIIYIDSDITTADELEMKRIADVIVRKSSSSNKRLLDELELFLYKVQEKKTLPFSKLNKSVDFEATLQGKKVLLVDDDMRNVFALSAALERQQMEIITANDGKEALQVLKENTDVDIVLMDIMMPEMDGFEAMRIIRHKMKLMRLPLIALTAKAMSGDREKCLAAGASDYISKPVDIHKLISLMRVWLS
ncbi:response regulator [Segetibacter sp.]|jgi:signal transduction histidine kinase/CheY-like chemotaxis protein/CHASE3 domain sensor protein|uniref:response regulator n=1 Tax=Segetibacter sp. TaxID=2231182 RepID=UPI00260F6407|nr:response regulator [Segetibacter sp.]MCW3080638.1 sensor histidine kinase [Segetibacter sp.]